MKDKFELKTDQRKFTIVYNDFLESGVLNAHEKMIFITLKKFANQETMQSFPSLNTIHKITRISVSTIQRSLKHMEELGIIKIEHKIGEDKSKQNNIYTLYDFKEMWENND